MDVSKKTLHKIHSRREFIENAESKIRKSEASYKNYQDKKEHLYDTKSPGAVKRVHDTLTKPYEVQYHITRTTDDNGKTVYKQGFKIAEASHHAHQRGVLHKMDELRRNNLKSDVKGLKVVPHVIAHTRPARAIGSATHKIAETSAGSAVVNAAHKAADTKVGHVVTKTLRFGGNTAYKAASLGAEGAFRTGLAAETALITVGDTVKNRSKAALESKVRQDAQGDADKSGLFLAAHTYAITKGLVQHIHDKQHYKPLQRNLSQHIKQIHGTAKADKQLTNAQNKEVVKSMLASERFHKITGRTPKSDNPMQYILSKQQKSKLIHKADKREYKGLKKVFKQNPSEANKKQLHLSKQNLMTSKNTLKVQKIDGKLAKLRNRKDKAQLKLYKLKNHSLASKAAAGLAVNFYGSLRNQAMKDGAADNDAVMAVDKLSTIGRRTLKNKSKDVKINKKLKKYSKREEAFHKKSARKKKKVTNRNKSNYNAKQVYKEYAAKKAKRAVRKRKASKFGFAAIGTLAPFLLLPLLLVSCLGIFANPGNFNFVTAYYGATDASLTAASDYYQELAYNMNNKVLSVPQDWKNRLSELGIPSNYTDAPEKFIFGNSTSLPSDTTYDFDKHKFYSFMCAYLLTKDEEGAVKNWRFNDEAKKVVEQLFNAQYEFKSHYANSSHWSYRNSFDYEGSGYYSYESCFWDPNVEFAYVEITHPDSLPIDNVTDDNKLYFNVNNGEIVDYNNSFAATGWYLKNQYYDTTDPSGQKYEGWYKDTECTYGIYNNGVLTIPFPHVIYEEKWVSILHKYDRIKECTLYYTVNRKKAFKDCIKDVLLSLEEGEALYEYYLILSDETEPHYYGLHQLGTSPVYNGYIGLMENNLILHGYGSEMHQWNNSHCSFSTNGQKHSGISIVQNSGSNVYAMVSGKITEVGENHFILHGFESDRDFYVEPIIVYCNVDTSKLAVGQLVAKGDILTQTNNRRQEMKYKKSLNDIIDADTGFVELINHNCGLDYLNITIFDDMNVYRESIDPEIIISLANK